MARKKRTPAGDKEPEPLTYAQVMAQEVAHTQQIATSSWMLHQWAVRSRWLDTMIKAVVAAQDLTNRNISPDLFRVYTLLGTRWFSHHQAIFALLVPGRYGEAAAMCRMLIEHTDLISYFALYPEDAAGWRAAFSKAPLSGNVMFQRGRNRFSPSAVRRRLEEKGIKLYSQESYAALSSAVHASEWGAQYYGFRPLGQWESLNLQFGTRFDTRVAFRIGALANSTLTFPIWSFIEMCAIARAPKSVTRKLKAEYDRNLPYWEAMSQVDKNFDDLMVETESRIAQGEPFDDIKKDIDGRYDLPENPDPRAVEPRPPSGNSNGE